MTGKLFSTALRYAKAIVAAAGTAATLIVALNIHPPAWVTIVLGAITTLGVALTPNKPRAAVPAAGAPPGASAKPAA